MLKVRYIFDLDDKPVNEYTITNGRYQFSAINVGAAITKIIVPNQNEKLENITLRYHNYKDYILNSYFIGALVDASKLMYDKTGVIQYYFECEVINNGLIFKYTKGDHYIIVKYSLMESEFMMEYDTNMGMNLTHVMYFNLNGNLKDDILNHNLIVNDKEYTITKPIDFFDKVESSLEGFQLLLKENGISFSLHSNGTTIYLSNGNYFDEQFFINKKETAKTFSGLGIMVSGNEMIKYIKYSFKN